MSYFAYSSYLLFVCLVIVVKALAIPVTVGHANKVIIPYHMGGGGVLAFWSPEGGGV